MAAKQMRHAFTKMNGLGNDFVVFNAFEQPLSLSADQCRHIADRRFGIGCDQILLVEPPQSADCDFFFRIFNADGSEAGQCGNGARCFARFVRDQGLTQQSEITIETLAGPMQLHALEDGQVRVAIGVPSFAPENIPISVERAANTYPVSVAGHELELYCVSVGNPHAICLVDDVQQAPVEAVGQALQSHPMFPEKANVEFMQICSRDQIKLRIYERGVGETLACGSGACAAAAAGIQQGVLAPKVSVSMTGGDLLIEWPGDEQTLWMTGPAETVFEGSIEL